MVASYSQWQKRDWNKTGGWGVRVPQWSQQTWNQVILKRPFYGSQVCECIYSIFTGGGAIHIKIISVCLAFNWKPLRSGSVGFGVDAHHPHRHPLPLTCMFATKDLTLYRHVMQSGSSAYKDGIAFESLKKKSPLNPTRFQKLNLATTTKNRISI